MSENNNNLKPSNALPAWIWSHFLPNLDAHTEITETSLRTSYENYRATCERIGVQCECESFEEFYELFELLFVHRSNVACCQTGPEDGLCWVSPEAPDRSFDEFMTHLQINGEKSEEPLRIHVELGWQLYRLKHGRHDSKDALRHLRALFRPYEDAPRESIEDLMESEWGLYGHLMLRWAMHWGLVEAAEYLSQFVIMHGDMVIHAASCGSMKLLERALKELRDDDKHREEDLASAMYTACEKGNIAILRRLLEASKDPSHKGSRDLPPLAGVCENTGSSPDELREMTRMLLSRGADPTAIYTLVVDGEPWETNPLLHACDAQIYIVGELVKAIGPPFQEELDECLSLALEFGLNDALDDDEFIAAIRALLGDKSTPNLLIRFVTKIVNCVIDEDIAEDLEWEAVLLRRCAQLHDLRPLSEEERFNCLQDVVAANRLEDDRLPSIYVRLMRFLLQSGPVSQNLTRLLVSALDGFRIEMAKVLYTWGAQTEFAYHYMSLFPGYLDFVRLNNATKRARSFLSALSSVRRVMLVTLPHGIVDPYLTATISLHLWHFEHVLLADSFSLQPLWEAHRRHPPSALRRWLLEWEDFVRIVQWCLFETQKSEKKPTNTIRSMSGRINTQCSKYDFLTHFMREAVVDFFESSCL